MTETTKPNYPCYRCGKARTKTEGGLTFSVCDDCWVECNRWGATAECEPCPCQRKKSECDGVRAELERMKRVDAEAGGAWEAINVQDNQIDALRAELATAEARVKELEKLIVRRITYGDRSEWEADLWDQGCAILARDKEKSK